MGLLRQVINDPRSQPNAPHPDSRGAGTQRRTDLGVRAARKPHAQRDVVIPIEFEVGLEPAGLGNLLGSRPRGSRVGYRFRRFTGLYFIQLAVPLGSAAILRSRVLRDAHHQRPQLDSGFGAQGPSFGQAIHSACDSREQIVGIEHAAHTAAQPTAKAPLNERTVAQHEMGNRRAIPSAHHLK
jgi:hypothetical protein